MAFFKVTDSCLQPIAPSTFAGLGLKERQDLQALLRDNPGAIGADLMVVAEEFSNWQDSSRRVDLLAIDKDSNLVVIELKRVEEGGHMELQALRYAAMLSTVDFSQIVEAYEKLLKTPALASKRPSDAPTATQELLDFLEVGQAEDVVITANPQIVLMAPSFSKEMTTTVLWLNERGVNIRCLSVEPYHIDGNVFLEIEQVIPLPSAQDYVVQRREKVVKAEKQAANQKKRARSLPALLEAGLLNPGDILELIRLPRGVLHRIPAEARLAELVDESQVKWMDGKNYSLSGLCSQICNQFVSDVIPDGYVFAGPDNWAKKGETTWLSELARSIEFKVQ